MQRKPNAAEYLIGLLQVAADLDAAGNHADSDVLFRAAWRNVTSTAEFGAFALRQALAGVQDAVQIAFLHAMITSTPTVEIEKQLRNVREMDIQCDESKLFEARMFYRGILKQLKQLDNIESALQAEKQSALMSQ